MLERAKSQSLSSVGRASSVVSVASSLPPHLRSHGSKAASGDTGVSSSSIRSGSLSTATTMRDTTAKMKSPEKVALNAWRADGKYHEGVKSRTVLPSIGQESAASPGQGRDQTKVEDKVTGQGKGRRNWAKAPRLPRAELEGTPSLPHVSVRHPDADVDHARRMEYCESDDSDF